MRKLTEMLLVWSKKTMVLGDDGTVKFFGELLWKEIRRFV
jgi:hypothetical protein